MNRCKDCKFWHEVQDIGFYTKEQKKEIQGKRYCDRIGEIGAKMDVISDAADDTDLWADLFTEPDFGCTEWKKKE